MSGVQIQSVLLALAAFSTVGVGGEEPFRESVKHYDISGSTAEELRDELDRLGPVGSDGKRYHGLTEWYVRWRFEVRQSEGSCKLANFDVTVDVTTTFPRWTDQSRGSRRLIERWQQYSEALATHERGHMGIAVRAATSIRGRVARLQNRAGCAELEQAVNAAANAVLEKARREEVQYDKRTRHGGTQGARFP